MFLLTGCVPSTGGTGASTIQPLATPVCGVMVIGAPPSMVAHTCVTPTSASTTVARMGIFTSELTSYDEPLAGPVVVATGGLLSLMMVTVFDCVTGARPANPSVVESVST